MNKLIKIVTALLIVIMCLSASAFADARVTVEATKVQSAPTIDGVISQGEWGEPIFSGSPLDENAPFYIPDSVKSDLIPTNIKIYVTWDADCLYVAAEVTDPLPWNGNVGAECWMGDGLQLDICVSDTNQKSRWRTNTAYSTADGNTYAYVNSVPNAAQDGFEFAGDPEKTNAPFYYGSAKATLNGNTFIYETSYPWIFYGNRATIEAGHSVLMNIAFYVADGTMGDDGSTYRGYIAYGNTVDGKLNYPLLVLSDETIIGLPAESQEPITKPDNTDNVPTAQPDSTASQVTTTQPDNTDSAPTVQPDSTVSQVPSQPENTSDLEVIAIVFVAVAVVAVAVAALLVFRSKKK